MKAEKLNILLLKGGMSAEREVSLKTGEGVAAALKSLGHQVTEVDVKSKDIDVPKGTDFVFTCLHGTFGEDGELQKILIAKKVRFNGSGVEGCQLSWDKSAAKKLFQKNNVPTPKGSLWSENLNWKAPYIIKPVAQGSSVGVFRVMDESEIAAAKKGAKEFGEPMMIEELIVGRELTVGVLGEEALPIIELRPKQGFYDYKNKYTAGMTEHLCPAPISEELTKRAQGLALAAHRALKCEVYSRVDVMMNEKNECFVLEVNTIPGMTGLSLLPEAAKETGLSYAALCQKIIDLSWDIKR